MCVFMYVSIQRIKRGICFWRKGHTYKNHLCFCWKDACLALLPSRWAEGTQPKPPCSPRSNPPWTAQQPAKVHGCLWATGNFSPRQTVDKIASTTRSINGGVHGCWVPLYSDTPLSFGMPKSFHHHSITAPDFIIVFTDTQITLSHLFLQLRIDGRRAPVITSARLELNPNLGGSPRRRPDSDK